MSTVKPPPLPGGEHPAISYIRFALAMLPSAGFLQFGKIFLYPKILALWEDAGLAGGKVQWLVNTTDLLGGAFIPLVGLTILVSVLMEFRERTWRWLRSWVLLFASAGLNLIVLVAITLIAITACLAAPMAAHKSKAKDAKVQPSEKTP